MPDTEPLAPADTLSPAGTARRHAMLADLLGEVDRRRHGVMVRRISYTTALALLLGGALLAVLRSPVAQQPSPAAPPQLAREARPAQPIRPGSLPPTETSIVQIVSNDPTIDRLILRSQHPSAILLSDSELLAELQPAGRQDYGLIRRDGRTVVVSNRASSGNQESWQ